MVGARGVGNFAGKNEIGMILYRVLEGKHKGMDGKPLRITPNGQRVSLRLGNMREVWFMREQIRRLSCVVINCRNYTWSLHSFYCTQCGEAALLLSAAEG